MTDDLVKRARHNALSDMPHYASVELIEALADRIEELTATNEQLSNCVAVLEADLRKMTLDYLAAQGQASENFQMYVDANEARIDAEAKLAKNEALMQAGFTEYGRRLAKAMEALDDDRVYGVITHTSLATLAELKGETDE